MPIGMPDSAVKPLGKTSGYNDKFEQVIDSCKDAFAQGTLEILGTPKYQETVTYWSDPNTRGHSQSIFHLHIIIVFFQRIKSLLI